MADYNIYIRSTGVGGINNPTKPWSQNDTLQSQTESWSGIDEKITNIAGIVSNPDSLVYAGMSAVKKAVPFVLVAQLVVSTADKLITDTMNLTASFTGDYRNTINYSNFKNNIGLIFNPFSSILNNLRLDIQNYIQNKRTNENLKLLGDTTLNAFTKRGV